MITLTPTVQPIIAHTNVTAEQVASLITAIASANPAVLALPDGKAYADVSRFMLIVRPDGAGMLDVVF